MRVLYGSQKKQRFPQTALTDWFFSRDGVRLLRGRNQILKYIAGLFSFLNTNL